jgi:type IV secretory pathway TrbD component
MNLKGFVALLIVLGILWLATAFGVVSWLLEDPVAAAPAVSSPRLFLQVQVNERSAAAPAPVLECTQSLHPSGSAAP